MAAGAMERGAGSEEGGGGGGCRQHRHKGRWRRDVVKIIEIIIMRRKRISSFGEGEVLKQDTAGWLVSWFDSFFKFLIISLRSSREALQSVRTQRLRREHQTDTTPD